ncbi:hypothetical protein SAMN05428975_3122 [Mucilaginibacter sp. OK268]|uniref:hypothetical protein n=1 Tax=Mucilaginibacter sp. OK268 TaxID=1881048 RepID=UPI0008914A6B|nr:hypothetical protein [Mucilaginibacter sp. OK268]SDP86359.1 hypothetical protein SAMN05428975_3122 [Mucilaginibacter sp. OK268]
MKKRIKISALGILLFIISCDSNNKIATIKNNTSGIIACALLKNEIMTDSTLYNDTSYMGYLIPPQHYDTYMVLDSNLLKAPDSAIRYIYILKLDSLNKFRKLKLTNGILKHSLLKKIVVQLNKVREPVDTIYAR